MSAVKMSRYPSHKSYMKASEANLIAWSGNSGKCIIATQENLANEPGNLLELSLDSILRGFGTFRLHLHNPRVDRRFFGGQKQSQFSGEKTSAVSRYPDHESYMKRPVCNSTPVELDTS